MINQEQAYLLEVNPVDLLAADGISVGRLRHIYRDPASDQPVWVSVAMGWPGQPETLVPLEGCVLTELGLQVPFTPQMIASAPQVDDGDLLRPDEEDALYDHYYGSLLRSRANKGQHR